MTKRIEVNMTPSGSEQAVKRLLRCSRRCSGRAVVSCFASSLVLASFVVMPSASADAQTASVPQRPVVVRERRATNVADDTSSQESPAEPSALEEGATPAASSLDRLRAEIAAAKSDAERATLERRFVLELVETTTPANALAELRRLLEGARFDPPLYYNIGNHLARLGDTGAATTAYRKAIAQRQGNYPRALNNLGVILMRRGDWVEAEEAFLNALRQENFTYAEAHYNLGRLYERRGETELAARHLQRVLKLNLAHVPAALLLANTLFADGNRNDALKVLASVRPADDGARRQIADLRAALNVAEFEADKPNGETLLPNNTIAARNSNREASKANSARTLSRARARASVSPASGSRRYRLDEESFALLQTARDRREAGKYEESIALYRRVLGAQQGALPPAQLELAYALIALRRNREALSVLDAVAARHGAEYPIVHYHLARLHESNGDLEAAAAAFTRAAVLFGDRNPQFLLDLSRVREKQTDYHAALTAFEAYLAANERTGSVADWTAARLALLREKASTAKQP